MDEVYTDRFVTVSILSEEEANEYRNMTTGVSVTDEIIRCVAENGEEKQIIEITANGFNRIRVKRSGCSTHKGDENFGSM